MFVRYYLELPLAAAQVEQTLVGAPPGWLAALSATAQERDQALELGPPVHLPTMTWLSLRWEPVAHDGPLPHLDATIELGPLGRDRTQLAISARYRQATSGPGADPGLAQRVAEATLKDFLDQLGHAIVLSNLGPAANIRS
jgi:hypothetical protein